MGQQDQQNDYGTLTGKLSAFLIIMLLDVVGQVGSQYFVVNKRDVYIKFPKMGEFGINVGLHEALFFVFTGVSAFMQFMTIFWTCTLIWKTALFRIGPFNQRFCQEFFPLLFCIIMHALLFFFEKSYRIVSAAYLV